MNENIKLLKEKFKLIQNQEQHKSLRTGTTGIGYTLEYLLGKKEDHSYLPDFNGIEIKTKTGYSKSPLTLFCLTPLGYENTISYLLNRFGYKDNTKKFKSFKGDAFANKKNIISNKYIFKLKIDYTNETLNLIILDLNLNILDDNIYWSLEEIKNRLYTKLNYLDYVNGYPYKRNNSIYYKYTSLKIYKLKQFENFLNLIEEDLIYVAFNIGTFKSGARLGMIHDHGTAFKLKHNCLNKLFDFVE